MPDIFQVLARWRKQVMLVVFISLLIAAAVLFLLPPKYLASSTALPANPLATDKAIVFNNNLRDLYSGLGQPGDLDRIVGTAQLDTIYLAMVDRYNLIDHYRIGEASPFSRIKAAAVLKKKTKVSKTGFGELKIQVWDKDRLMAPQLANSLMALLDSFHRDLQNKSNRNIAAGIHDLRLQLQVSVDSIRGALQTAGISPALARDYLSRQSLLQEQILQYEKLETEYQLMLGTEPPALFVVERARISDRPDQPAKWAVLLATAVLSSFFAIWLAVLLEKRNAARQ